MPRLYIVFWIGLFKYGMQIIGLLA